MPKRNYISDLTNLHINHKENLFQVETDPLGNRFYDLSDTVYDLLGDYDPSRYYSHKITSKDTMFGIALKYYDDKSLWWVIGVANDIDNPFTLREQVGGNLKIPKRVLVGQILSEISR